MTVDDATIKEECVIYWAEEKGRPLMYRGNANDDNVSQGVIRVKCY